MNRIKVPWSHTPGAPVISFLLEKVEGRFANWDGLKICKAALQRLHDLGISRGDRNHCNFIIGSNDIVALIDFDH